VDQSRLIHGTATGATGLNPEICSRKIKNYPLQKCLSKNINTRSTIYPSWTFFSLYLYTNGTRYTIRKALKYFLYFCLTDVKVNLFLYMNYLLIKILDLTYPLYFL